MQLKVDSKVLYTIGHSTQSVEDFINLLKKHHINCVVDVRSTPYSQYTPQFNENDIKYALKKEGIQYIFMGKEFGARRGNKDLYDSSGKLDFEKTTTDGDFIKGINRIKEGLAKGFTIAFMCTEKEPQDCHRCILVGKTFNDMLGIRVENIKIDGSLISQDDIGRMLVEKYFPERGQVSLFSTDNKTEQEYIDDAYRRRGQEIAYQMSE